MQIKSLAIKNYRSLKNVPVGSLKTINMIYGYNNTGKSNFLRFIEMVFSRKVRSGFIKYATPSGQTEEQRTEESSDWWEGELKHPPFMFTDDDKNVEITFAILMDVLHSELKDLPRGFATEFLSKGGSVAHIYFEGNIQPVSDIVSEISLTKVTINKKPVYDSSAKSELRYFPSSETLVGQNETLSSLLAIFNDCILFLGSDRYLAEEQELSNVTGKLRAQNAKNWLFGCYMDSQKYAKFEDFIAFIKTYQSRHTEKDAENAWYHWPLSTGDIGFGRFGQNIDVMLRNPNGRFPLSSYGTGVQQIFYLLSKLFFSPTHIVLIEEIELNLSPTAQKELFVNLKRLLESSHLDQLLFTTHSNYFNYRGDFQIYEAVLNKEGYTNINRKRAASGGFFKRDLIE